MSLGSRLVNAIFPSQSSSLAAANGNDQAQDTSAIAFHDGLFKDSDSQSRFLEKSKAMEEEEVEGRPPFLHVSYGALHNKQR